MLIKKITKISLDIRFLDLKAELARLTSLKEILDLVVLSKMNDVWNNILIPKFVNLEEHDELVSTLNEWMDSERDEVNRLFSFSILSSIFTTAYYKVENELNFICQLIAKDSGLESELHKIDDSGIFKSKSFLENIVEIKIPEQWSEIVSYSRIRNSIAHTSGIAKRKKLINYIKNSANIELDEINRIVLEIKFIDVSIVKMESFIGLIIENIKEK